MNADEAAIVAMASKLYPKPQDVTIAIRRDTADRFGLEPNGHGWCRVSSNGRRINIAVVEDIEAAGRAEDKFPLLHRDLDITNEALRVWQLFTGQAWYGTPGLAGTDVLQAKLRKMKPRGPTLRPSTTGPDNGADSSEQPYYPWHWKRTEEAPFVHGYDAKRQYLAAMTCALVAPWTLKNTGRIRFNRKLAGWWRIQVPAWNDDRLPDPAGYGPPERWVTTPTAKLLDELAAQGLSGGFTVLDSWTGPGRTLFREWAETMDRGYLSSKQAGSQLLSNAFKAAGARQTHGLFNSESSGTYRPDWYHCIVATARTNLWRKMRSVADMENRYPLDIHVDHVRYSSQSPDAERSAPSKFVIGDRLGQFEAKDRKLGLVAA